MVAQLKNGGWGAPGGYRKGAGRKPDAYKAALKKIAEGPKTLKFLKDAVEGEDVDIRLAEGQIYHLSPTADTRHKIWESVHDRVHGKPASVIDLSQMEEGAELGLGIVILPAQRKK